MALKQMVTGNLPTFIGGALVPPNTPVMVDDDVIDLDTAATDNDGKEIKGKKRDIGLHPMTDAHRVPQMPIAIAAIGPTGPNPTAPQQLPPARCSSWTVTRMRRVLRSSPRAAKLLSRSRKVASRHRPAASAARRTRFPKGAT